MDKKEAQRRFQKADKLFTYGRFDDVLLELETLEEHFPDNHRLLNAKARTLNQLGRHDESLAVCDRLLNEFDYEKIRAFRDGVAHTIATGGAVPPPPATGHGPAAAAQFQDDEDEEPKKRGIVGILIRLVILGAIAALTYFGYIPYWLGGGLIGAYILLKIAIFIIKKLFGRLVLKLFSAPFKMKGKALEGATCELHGFEWTEKPANLDGEYEEDDEDPEEFEEEGPKEPRRYVWLDVTITPQPRTEGFTHWEPGELMLAPISMQTRDLDSLDDCYPIHDYKLSNANPDINSDDEDMGKFVGPLRLKLLAEVPVNENVFKFAYYFEQFGELRLDGA